MTTRETAPTLNEGREEAWLASKTISLKRASARRARVVALEALTRRVFDKQLARGVAPPTVGI